MKGKKSNPVSDKDSRKGKNNMQWKRNKEEQKK